MTNHQLKSINPKDNSIINLWDIHSQSEINTIIKKTADAQSNWQLQDLSSRITIVKELAHVFQDKNKELSILMADEMGKPIKQGMAEIEKCVWLCNYYVDNAENF